MTVQFCNTGEWVGPGRSGLTPFSLRLSGTSPERHRHHSTNQLGSTGIPPHLTFSLSALKNALGLTARAAELGRGRDVANTGDGLGFGHVGRGVHARGTTQAAERRGFFILAAGGSNSAKASAHHAGQCDCRHKQREGRRERELGVGGKKEVV